MKIKTICMFLIISGLIFCEQIVVEHTVQRISEFSIQHSFPEIIVGDNIIGTFIVNNNTIDGYKVGIKSQYEGVLKSLNPEDGGGDLTYTVKVDRISGVIGGNVTFDQEPSVETALSSDILSVSGTQTSPTNAQFRVVVHLPSDGGQLQMAGSYEDKLTVIYTDL